MKEALQAKLNDSLTTRWIALILVSLMMFCGYMVIDVMSPLQTMIQKSHGWTPEVFGYYASSEYFINVFICFLIFAGIILDKIGIRRTGILSASLMLIGSTIKLYGISTIFTDGGFGFDFFNSFLVNIPASAKVACIGFAIFGCGVEMAGITVSKAIAKWFKGKEMALAMGVEMAIARLGLWAIFRIAPNLADKYDQDVVVPIAFCTLMLIIGLLSYIVFSVMDSKLDKQTNSIDGGEVEEPFKISDVGKLFTNRVFMIVAILCVLYYSAIFPFQRFATGMLESRLGISANEASQLFSWFPIGAMVLTPILGLFLDKVGKGATMLMIGSVLVFSCHLIFALAPLTEAITYVAIIILGVSFSLVPASLWPSVPKLVDERYLGSGYSVIFWIQNMGLFATPVVIGWALEKFNPGVTEAIHAGQEATYNYTVPMLIFASFGVIAFFLAFWLKVEDKKHNYGLETPNIKE